MKIIVREVGQPILGLNENSIREKSSRRGLRDLNISNRDIRSIQLEVEKTDYCSSC